MVYRPKDGSWSIVESYSGQAEVAYFELAISICQNIFWFQISMKYICCNKLLKDVSVISGMLVTYIRITKKKYKAPNQEQKH